MFKLSILNYEPKYFSSIHFIRQACLIMLRFACMANDMVCEG